MEKVREMHNIISMIMDPIFYTLDMFTKCCFELVSTWPSISSCYSGLLRRLQIHPGQPHFERGILCNFVRSNSETKLNVSSFQQTPSSSLNESKAKNFKIQKLFHSVLTARLGAILSYFLLRAIERHPPVLSSHCGNFKCEWWKWKNHLTWSRNVISS